MCGSKNWFIYTMEYYTAEKKEWTPILWDSMNRTGDYYAKWNKPGGERQLP